MSLKIVFIVIFIFVNSAYVYGGKKGKGGKPRRKSTEMLIKGKEDGTPQPTIDFKYGQPLSVESGVTTEMMQKILNQLSLEGNIQDGNRLVSDEMIFKIEKTKKSRKLQVHYRLPGSQSTTIVSEVVILNNVMEGCLEEAKKGLLTSLNKHTTLILQRELGR